MSRPIKFTEKLLEEVKKEFAAHLSTTKMFDGKVSFSKEYVWKGDDKATIVFTPTAYLKMFRLIQEFSDEVAWHGVAKRSEEDESTFFITDILVYPQEVTGATVNTDQVKYQTWLMELPDEVFNNLRMQGHSHVNMAPSPSSVDTTHQEAILGQLEDSMFYIFMIWNKSLKHNIKIFDLKNNTLYEDEDIVVKFPTDDESFDDFIKESKELVKKKSTYSYGGGGYGYAYQKTSKPTQKKEEKKEESKVGSGWKGRGRSARDDYYKTGYEYYDDYNYYE